MKNKKCLLIMPLSFYSMGQQICETLKDFGYETICCNEEYPNNLIGKILGNLKCRCVLHFFTRKRILQIYSKSGPYDQILIIKGRGVDVKLIDKLKQSCKNIIGYNFDSFGYNPLSLDWYTSVDRFCTFDYRDAEKYKIPLVELFTSIPFINSSQNLRTYNLSVIQRNHSNRLKFMDDVLSTLHLDPQNIYIWIYEKNIITGVINFIRSPLLYLKYLKYISFSPIPYSKYMKVLAESEFTLDYAHPLQSGSTIRCFEAIGLGTKIITNNKYTVKNEHFKDVLLFSKNASFVEEYNKSKEISVPLYRRTINDFIRDLLNI